VRPAGASDGAAALVALRAGFAALVAAAAAAVPAPVAALKVAAWFTAAVFEFAALRTSAPSSVPAAAAVAAAMALAIAELPRGLIALLDGRLGGLCAPEEALEPAEEALGGRIGGRPGRNLIAPRVLVARLLAPEGVVTLLATVPLGRAAVGLGPALRPEGRPLVATGALGALLRRGSLAAGRRRRLPPHGLAVALRGGKDLDLGPFGGRGGGRLLGLRLGLWRLFGLCLGLRLGWRGSFGLCRLAGRRICGLRARKRISVLTRGRDDLDGCRLVVCLYRGC
jgi:hypothetical protein